MGCPGGLAVPTRCPQEGADFTKYNYVVVALDNTALGEVEARSITPSPGLISCPQVSTDQGLQQNTVPEGQ